VEGLDWTGLAVLLNAPGILMCLPDLPWPFDFLSLITVFFLLSFSVAFVCYAIPPRLDLASDEIIGHLDRRHSTALNLLFSRKKDSFVTQSRDTTVWQSPLSGCPAPVRHHANRLVRWILGPGAAARARLWREGFG
jgi:hypothetical protein